MDLNSANNPQKDLWSLKSIERISIILSIILFVGVLYLKPTQPMILGIAAGALVGWLNFKLLGRFVSKIVEKSQVGAAKNGFALILKMILLIAIVGVLILVVKVNPIAFVLGFSANILAIFIEAIRVMF